MNYFKINYGNEDDNYGIILTNNNINELNTFKEDIQNIFQSMLYIFLESQDNLTPSTFHWVDCSMDDFIKLGYKKVNNNSIAIKYSFADEDNNVQLLVDEALVSLGIENEQNATLFEVIVFSEFEPGNTFSSYFLCIKNDFEKFNLEIVNYLNSNPIVYNSEILLYLEALEVYMISIGYEIINPLTYQISCSYTLESLPNQWEEILGSKLYFNIKKIKKPIAITNSEDYKDLEEELPF
jgi:hypothetical protein